jgi:hypothetical protein
VSGAKRDDLLDTARKRISSAGQLVRAVPRQEVLHSAHRMVGDTGQHMAQPSLGIDTDSLAVLIRRQRIRRRCQPRQQVVAAVQRDAAQGAFGGRVVDLDAAVIAVARQCRPQLERIQDGPRRVRFARERAERGCS